MGVLKALIRLYLILFRLSVKLLLFHLQQQVRNFGSSRKTTRFLNIKKGLRIYDSDLSTARGGRI